MQIDSELPYPQAISEVEHRRLRKILMKSDAPLLNRTAHLRDDAG